MPSPKKVLLLKIGPGKVVLFLNNRTQIINSLKKTVFQDLHTLKVENFKFWVKIWNWLGKSFPKMVLLLKIGSGKVVLFLNNRTQKIPLIPFSLIWRINKSYSKILSLSLFQAWDMGHGFSMPELYKTGYTVLGLSIISAAIVSLM